MTDHRAHDYHGQAVSDCLARHQHTLSNSLDDVLDIEAGLREILIHSRHDIAVDNLDTVLNTEAGLAAILPTTTPEPATPATTHDPVDAEELLRTISPAPPLRHLVPCRSMGTAAPEGSPAPGRAGPGRPVPCGPRLRARAG